jgi:ATP-dependent Clp protease adapter protein ClpS
MFNSDIISFEFVLSVLLEIFNKSTEEAIVLTGMAHTYGKATIAILPERQADVKLKKISQKCAVAIANNEIGEELRVEKKEINN